MSDNDQKIDEPVYETLPTGKMHISFSEMRDWQDCSYRHKIKHIDKINLFIPVPIIDFGTAIHSACEDYARTRIMKSEIACNSLTELFELNKEIPAYTEELLLQMKKEAISVCADVPKFIDDTFKDWECVDAEHYLYEPIEKYPHAFKGYIDFILKVKGKRGEDLYWLLDWKSTAWGWKFQKKSDYKVHQQLVLYKNFWAKKTGINPKNIRCGFILLKRTAKPGTHCELLTVSVGDVTTHKSLKVLNSSVNSIRKNIAIKNRYSCQYCEYKNTEYCT